MFLLYVARAAFIQASAAGAVSLGAWFRWDGTLGLAVLYGSMAAMLNTLLLYWRWRRGALDYHCDPARHLKGFYRSSLERFFVVGLWLGVGFAWVKLPPAPMLAGFVIGQLAWVIASLALRERH